MDQWKKFTRLKTIIVGTVACLNDKQQFLIVRRSKTDVIKPGSWEFPGGHVDDSDGSIEDGAARELEEEANLASDPTKLIYLGLTNEIKPAKDEPNLELQIRKHYFLALDWKNEAKIVPNPKSGILEHDDLRWVTKEEIESINNTEIPIYLVDKALKIQKDRSNVQN